MLKSEILSYVIFLNGSVFGLGLEGVNHLLSGGSLGEGLSMDNAIGGITNFGDDWEHEIFGLGVIRRFAHHPTKAEMAIAATSTFIGIGVDPSMMGNLFASYAGYINATAANKPDAN